MPAEFTKVRNVHTFPRSLYISSHTYTYSFAAHSQDVRLQQTLARDKAATHVHNMIIQNGPCGMWCIRKTGLVSTEVQWKSVKHYGQNSPL